MQQGEPAWVKQPYSSPRAHHRVYLLTLQRQARGTMSRAGYRRCRHVTQAHPATVDKTDLARQRHVTSSICQAHTSKYQRAASQRQGQRSETTSPVIPWGEKSFPRRQRQMRNRIHVRVVGQGKMNVIHSSPLIARSWVRFPVRIKLKEFATRV